MSPAGALGSPGFNGLRLAERHSHYCVTVSDAGTLDEYLVVNYRVTPAPNALAGQTRLLEGERAGIAIDSRKRTYSDCRSGYRISRSGEHLIGALRIGPAPWGGLGEVTVVFAPFAHTPGLRRVLCQLQLIIDDAERVQVASLSGPDAI